MGWVSGRCSAGDGAMFLIQRLALLLLLSLPAFLPNTAFADYPKTLSRYLLNNWGYSNIDLQTVCTTFLNAKKSAYPSETILPNTCTEAQVTLKNQYNQVSYSNAITKYGTCSGVESLWGNGICTGSCAAPYTMVNGQCVPPPTCTAPLVLDPATNTCVDPCASKAGQPVSYFTIGQSWPYTCNDGCVAQGSSGDCGSNTSGQEGCFYVGTYTGVSCNGTENGTGSTPPAAGDSPEYDCIKQGKSYGTVNGVVVCVAAGTSGSAPTTSYEPASSTSSSTSSTDSTGTTSTSSSTSSGTKVVSFNPDGTVTEQTTNSTTNSDGTTSQSTEQKTQSKEDYCALNPASTNCKQQTSCEENPEGPECKHFCEKYPDSFACADLQSLKDEISALPADGGWLKKEFNLTFTKTVVPEAAGCPAPVTINIGFTSVSIPYDWLCEYAESFRSVVIAFAYIAAISILIGAYRKEA